MPALPESLSDSATTGFKRLGLVAENPIGQPLSEIGSGKPLMVSANLATMRPEETEERMQAALAQLSEQRPVFLTKRMYPNNGPTYVVTEGVRWSCPSEKLAEAARIVEGAFRAAPSDKISAALYRLRMLTMGRDQRSPEDQEAEYIIWIENLRCYPADIVLDTLGSWSSREDGKWWPTWHEVEAELKKRQDRRMALGMFVKTALERGLPALPVPEPTAATTEERERAYRDYMERVRQQLKGEVAQTRAQVEEAAKKRLRELYHEGINGRGSLKLSAEAVELALAKAKARGEALA
jgi:hypothetical protein